jgi:transcriptional regulator with XRE-family HTH domain
MEFFTYDLPNYLAMAIRGAREAEGISQSELARRAGLSPSVISRIEAGVVVTPDRSTRDRIAIALGRSARLLDELSYSGVLDVIMHLHEQIPVLREAQEEYDRDVRTERVDDDDWLEKWGEAVLNAAVAHFVNTRGLDDVSLDVDPATRVAVEEVLRVWPRLSDERREMVLRYLQDQYWLTIRTGKLSVGPDADRDDSTGN